MNRCSPALALALCAASVAAAFVVGYSLTLHLYDRFIGGKP